MKISVIVPAYNEQELLPACLKALQSQTIAADEIIVVDNNSSDKTAEIAHTHGVTVIHENQQGILSAVCAGMNAATGDIIARCDADSIVPDDWIERIEKTMTEKPNASGMTGPGRFYGTGGIHASFAQLWYMYAYFLLVGSALANWPLFGSNCAMRRVTWQNIEGKLHKNRNDIHDDMEISAHIMPTQRILFIPSLVVGISARSLRVNDMNRRYRYGWTTLSIHWRTDSPVQRWSGRLRIPHKV